MRLPRLLRRGGRPAADEPWLDDPDDPTVELLERFAQGPLSPDPAALARVRSAAQTAFLEAHRERMAAARAARTRSTHRTRALVAACSVALLMLSGAGLAAAQSGPGEPFYRTRLAVEAWFLPPAGSPDRVEADLSWTQARLDEATRAASSANWNGEADAMAAYRDAVASMSLPQDPAVRERVRSRLGDQLAHLEGLRAGARGNAAGEVDRAIHSVDVLMAGATQEPAQEPSAAPGASGHGPDATPGQDSGPSSGTGPKATPSKAPGSSSGAGPGAGSRPGGEGRGPGAS
jgi:hypothetical protein